jgi:molybdopterin-guanine dinucleotide biosynthesis protein A
MPEPLRTDTTALILAGGQARRMGGADKGLLDCGGRPLIEHVLARVAPWVAVVLISANRNLDQYRRLGHPVLEDARGDYPGPLAGIARGLERCATNWLWVVPCDAPLIDARLLARLADACREPGVSAAVPLEGGRMHTTFVLLHRDALASLLTYMKQDGRAVHAWLRSLPAAEVECNDHPEWFFNLNTPEDLAACAAQLPLREALPPSDDT